MSFKGFVAVHVGAGHHSQAKTEGYKMLCKDACKTGIKALTMGQPAVEVVTLVTEVLENSALTNAGYGSNLTEDGTVECDAGVMDGFSLQFGGVGAISGVKNPVRLAKKLIEEQQKGLQDLGRISPCMLVGPAATEYARQRQVETCLPQELISDSARDVYNHYKEKLNYHHQMLTTKKIRLEDVCNIGHIPGVEVNDTVGAVVMDTYGTVASAASSGGLLMKCSGRVGQAAMYGCGCWAQNLDETAVGSSTSGCGESLIRTLFAKESAKSFITEEGSILSVQKFMKTFLDSPFLTHIKEKQAGVIILKRERGSRKAEFLWSHTTASMCIGYQSATDPNPVSRMSRLPENDTSNLLIEGISLNV